MALTVSVKLVGKKGPLMDTQAVKRDISRTNQKFAKRMKRSFESSVNTWRHPPVFHQETSTADLAISVYTVDNVYFWLDQGTAIRYAVMTEDFSPKTRPGSLESRPGSGGFAYLDFKEPREGIEARRFAEQVEEKHGPDYEAEIESVLDRAARKNT